eukprot:7018677-Ditylum_brightwellii.AAC.1
MTAVLPSPPGRICSCSGGIKALESAARTETKTASIQSLCTSVPSTTTNIPPGVEAKGNSLTMPS